MSDTLSQFLSAPLAIVTPTHAHGLNEEKRVKKKKNEIW